MAMRGDRHLQSGDKAAQQVATVATLRQQAASDAGMMMQAT